jgi:hypothetical protein
MDVLRQQAKDTARIVAGWAGLLLLAVEFSMERLEDRRSGKG